MHLNTEARPVLTLLGLALVCALAANALASPQRRLAWSGWVPPVEVLPPAPMPAPMATPAPLPSPLPAPELPPSPSRAPQRALGPPLASPATPQAAPAPSPRFAAVPDATTRDISAEDAWAAFQLQVPFLDARRSGDFLEGHVAGAYSVPVWEADPERRITEFEARANPAPKSPIVIYCGGGDCEDSHLLARKLVTLGYRNLLIYRDGYPDWIAKGRPQAKGARP